MGYKSVSLSSDVYELLKEKKRSDESFSDFIKRLLEKPDIKQLIELAGAWSDVSADEIAALKRAIRGN